MAGNFSGKNRGHGYFYGRIELNSAPIPPAARITVPSNDASDAGSIREPDPLPQAHRRHFLSGKKQADQAFFAASPRWW